MSGCESSLKYHAPDTGHDTARHNILTSGGPVLIPCYTFPDFLHLTLAMLNTLRCRTVCKGTVYPGSAGQGLRYVLFLFSKQIDNNSLSNDCLIFFYFFCLFFFFLFGFYSSFENISLISSQSFIKGGRKPENLGKNYQTIRKQNLAFPMWPEGGLNHSGEKPNGLKVSSLIHWATGARFQWLFHKVPGKTVADDGLMPFLWFFRENKV